MDLVQPINNPRNNGQLAEYGNDQGLFVEFFNEPVFMEALSAAEGRTIFKDVEHIKIQPLGQNKTVVVRPVEESDKHRFAQKYAQFKNQDIQVSQGTPITEWAPISKSQALEFKSLGVHTVEDVANLSDANAMRFLGGPALREKAKAFLLQAKDGSALTAMQKENDDLRAKLDALEKTVNGLNIEKKKDNKNAV